LGISCLSELDELKIEKSWTGAQRERFCELYEKVSKNRVMEHVFRHYLGICFHKSFSLDQESRKVAVANLGGDSGEKELEELLYQIAVRFYVAKEPLENVRDLLLKGSSTARTSGVCL
jgi:hypothetical protein